MLRRLETLEGSLGWLRSHRALWLARMRWIALGAVLCCVADAVWVLHLAVRWRELFGLVGLGAVYAAIVHAALLRGARGFVVEEGQLLADVLALATLLFLSGGLENPFVVLLAVHVALAAVAFGTRAAAATAALVVVTVLALGLAPPLEGVRDEPSLFKWGVGLATTVAAGVVTYLARIAGRDLERASAEAEQARRRAVVVERLAAVGELAATVAHELNTPLATIRTLATGLSRASQDEGAKRKARLIDEETERCSRITRGLLSLARPGPGGVPRDAALLPALEPALRGAPEGALARLDVGELARRTVERLSHESGSFGSVEIETPAEGALVLADRGSLEQTLSNLVDNAIYAARSRGGKARVRVELAGDRIRVSVEDEGPGIDSAVRARLFEPFVTTKPQGEGTGLGLYIARGLAHALGGELRLEDRPGGGARAILELPRASAPATRSGGTP